MAFFSLDGDGRVEWVLKKTLFLWLFPYVVWYLGKEATVWVTDWVTEPDFSADGSHE